MTLRRLFICIVAIPMAVFLLAAGSAVSSTLRDAAAGTAASERAKRNQVLARLAAAVADQGLPAADVPHELLAADGSLLAVSWQPSPDASTVTAGDSRALTRARRIPVSSRSHPQASLILARPPPTQYEYPYWRLPAAGFALLAMAIAVALVLAQFVEHLLAGLTGMVRELERNNYRASLPPPITREAGLLVSGLNNLARSLRDRNRISHGYLAALRQKNQQLETQIVERQKIEDALAEEKARLQVTLSSLAEGVIATDTDGTIVLASQAACKLTGWPPEEAVGAPLATVFQLSPLGDGGSDAKDNRPSRRRLTRRDGSTCLVAESTAPIHEADGQVSGSVVVFRDVTAESRMEEELVRSQKHETTASLAGGIAHDFNNILTAIIGNISLARMDLAERHEARQLLAEAEGAATRARDLTRQLLVLTRTDRPMRRSINLREVVAAAADFSLHGSNVQLKTDFQPNLWAVEGDADQIHQVVQNLVLNADQAMPDGGSLVIALSNVDAEAAAARHLPDGHYVAISIRDQGAGMSAEDLKRAFDPFFTTRKRASGLGLPVTDSIVRNHGGQMKLEPNPDGGMTVAVYLPADPASTSANATARSRAAIAPAAATGARVLVMDDEDAIRLMIRRGLTRHGFQVVTSPHGADAIEKFALARDSGHPYDAVVLDLTIPGGVGGVECLRRIQDIDPNVLAIVASGYARDVQLSDFAKLGFRDFLRKPYRVEDLCELLRHHLATDVTHAT